MTSRLLFLNNYKDSGIPEGLDRCFERLDFQVEVRHVWAGDLLAIVAGFDALFLSGGEISPWEEFDWIDQVKKLVCQAKNVALPTLGICFGSQIIAHALCGDRTVFRKANYEIRLIDLTPSENLASDPIGRGIRGRFPIFSWHRDEIVADHPDIHVLATSEECGNHIWRYRDLPLWGIQAHPEAGDGASLQWLSHHREMRTFAGFDLQSPIYSNGFTTSTAMKLVENFANYVGAVGEVRRA